ncbi:MAG: flagellar hook-associated protein FlgL [Chloroflexi bacterium]|nr:flagellar hook-associated protein FlgL [Chloroflexota bacterium]
MRLSEQSRLTARVGYLQQVTQNLDSLQQQLSTNRRINRASDDPAGAAISLGHRENIAYEAQMQRNLSSGTAFINASEAALGSADESLQRIRELTVQAASDTVGASDRSAIAAEVNQLIGQLAQVANTNFAGAYIFAGYKSDQPAYTVTGSPPTAVTYQGDTGQRLNRISKQDAVPVNVVGSQVFGSMFTDLIALRDNLVGSAPTSAIAASVGTIDAALGRIIDARADLGARANRFEAAQQVSEQTSTDLDQLRAGIEEVDITRTIVQFQAAQNSYQAALGAIGRTASMTLLDYLR